MNNGKENEDYDRFFFRFSDDGYGHEISFYQPYYLGDRLRVVLSNVHGWIEPFGRAFMTKGGNFYGV